jgi:hypothetical protein
VGFNKGNSDLHSQFLDGLLIQGTGTGFGVGGMGPIIVHTIRWYGT